VFFLLVPVAPPWLASEQGYLPHVEKIINHTLPSAYIGVYNFFYANKVAAMPSLHVAFPVLALAYALRVFCARAWFLAAWVGAVVFSIVYLGEHYLVDAVAGALLAVAAMFATEAVWARLSRRRSDSVLHYEGFGAEQTGEAHPGTGLVQPVDADEEGD